MELEQLKLKIKTLIIDECEKEDDFEPHEIIDDEPLFGRKSRINLDSLDGLQLALVLKQQYGLKIEGSRQTRKHLESVNTIVALINSTQQEIHG